MALTLDRSVDVFNSFWLSPMTFLSVLVALWFADMARSVTFHFHASEKEMAPHSSVLAWRIPGMGEPGGLPSMGSHRVGHDQGDSAAAAAGSSTLTFTSG